MRVRSALGVSMKEDSIHKIVKKHLKGAQRILELGGVRDFGVEFGDDSTGDPAVWIKFEIDQDDDPSTQKVNALNELTDSVTRLLLERLGPDPWPYVRFRAIPRPEGKRGAPRRPA